MAALSGKEGYVSFASSDLDELTEWTLTFDPAVVTYFPRSGNGWQKTIRSVKKVSGTITLVYDNVNSIVALANVDTLVTIECHQDTNDYWSGSARIGQHTYGANLDGTEQTVTIAFESDGAWTFTES